MTKGEIYLAISNERARQVTEGWTSEHDSNHSREDWASILVNYIYLYERENYEQAEKRLIQIAAIAVAALEQR
jgi:hypothetical protein